MVRFHQELFLCRYKHIFVLWYFDFCRVYDIIYQYGGATYFPNTPPKLLTVVILTLFLWIIVEKQDSLLSSIRFNIKSQFQLYSCILGSILRYRLYLPNKFSLKVSKWIFNDNLETYYSSYIFKIAYFFLLIFPNCYRLNNLDKNKLLFDLWI